jgi:SAM-dependent methyltransferase
MSSQPYRSFSRAWPWEKVLDVGSGDNPHPRADTLVDNNLTDEHRWGPLREPERVILVDARSLPFLDKEFDVVLCAHCIEHCEEPEEVVQEITRVGRRGILEVPTPYLDVWFQPSDQHRWIFANWEGKLLYAPSPIYTLPMPTKSITVGLLRHNPLFRMAYLLDERAFRIRIRWSGRLPIERSSIQDVLSAQAVDSSDIPIATLMARLTGRSLTKRLDQIVGRCRRFAI